MACLGEDEPRFIQEAVRRINMEIRRIVEERLKEQIVKEMLREYLNQDRDWKWKVVYDQDRNLTIEGLKNPQFASRILNIMVEGLTNQIKFKYPREE